ncbi:MAG: NAD-dependent epimerase/dehydratase family protein [Clostridiales bacterium]|nr:NAD-dependent epimerase/dehydratase family protein [Clostridiales bacterium]
MRVGIIGAGEISEYHLKALKQIKTAQVVAICDADITRARESCQKHQIEKSYSNYREMIKESALDVLHVLAPPTYHKEIAVYAMQRGCHAVVEKPMALNYHDALEMVAASENTGRQLCVCEIYHFDPVVMKVRALLNTDAIGQLLYVESYWFTNLTDASRAYSLKGNGAGWAYGLPCGVFSNFLDHPVYLQREFLGNVEHVSTITKKVGDNPFIPYDELRISLESSDKLGYIVTSVNCNPRINTLKLFGTNGIITADLANMTITVSRNRRLPSFMAKGVNNLVASYQLLRDTMLTTAAILGKELKARQGLNNLLQAFYAEIEGVNRVNENTLFLSPQKTADTIRILHMVHESAANGKKENCSNEYECFRDMIIIHKTHNEKQKQKVLVTGASGFLAKHLINELINKNYIVRTLSRKKVIPFENNENMEVFYGDIRNQACVEKAVAGVDIIYHCASITTNKGLWRNFEETNIAATKNLLEAAKKFAVKRFVYVSSVAVYGVDNGKRKTVITESHEYAEDLPRYSYYAKSKIEAERLVFDYHKTAGLPTVVIRPGIIFGPGGKNISNKKRFVFGASNKVLPYIYVKNVVDALVLAGSKDIAVGQAYNVVDDEQITQGEFRRKIINVTDTKKISIFVPQFVMFAVACLLDLITIIMKNNSSPPFSIFHYKSLVRNMVYSNEKIKTELSWSPSISLDQGIIKTIADSGNSI